MRYNKLRSITLSAGLQKGCSLGEAIKYLENISDEKLKGEFIIDYKGQSKEYKKIFEPILFSFYCFSFYLFTLFYIAQFESFRYPLIIMLTVPLTLISL